MVVLFSTAGYFWVQWDIFGFMVVLLGTTGVLFITYVVILVTTGIHLGTLGVLLGTMGVLLGKSGADKMQPNYMKFLGLSQKYI